MSLNREQIAIYQADIERMHPLILERLIVNTPNVIDMREVFEREMVRTLENAAFRDTPLGRLTT